MRFDERRCEENLTSENIFIGSRWLCFNRDAMSCQASRTQCPYIASMTFRKALSHKRRSCPPPPIILSSILLPPTHHPQFTLHPPAPFKIDIRRSNTHTRNECVRFKDYKGYLFVLSETRQFRKTNPPPLHTPLPIHEGRANDPCQKRH